jgi:hypothetical protein
VEELIQAARKELECARMARDEAGPPHAKVRRALSELERAERALCAAQAAVEPAAAAVRLAQERHEAALGRRAQCAEAANVARAAWLSLVEAQSDGDEGFFDDLDPELARLRQEADQAQAAVKARLQTLGLTSPSPKARPQDVKGPAAAKRSPSAAGSQGSQSEGAASPKRELTTQPDDEAMDVTEEGQGPGGRPSTEQLAQPVPGNAVVEATAKVSPPPTPQPDTPPSPPSPPSPISPDAENKRKQVQVEAALASLAVADDPVEAAGRPAGAEAAEPKRQRIQETPTQG